MSSLAVDTCFVSRGVQCGCGRRLANNYISSGIREDEMREA